MIAHSGVWVKAGFSTACGVISVIMPNYKFFVLLLLAGVIDIVCALRLSARLYRKNPELYKPPRFSSRKFRSKIYSIGICFLIVILTYMIDVYLLGCEFSITKIMVGAMVGGELISILESEASANGSRWARIACRILVMKTERYLNVQEGTLKDKNDEILHD